MFLVACASLHAQPRNVIIKVWGPKGNSRGHFDDREAQLNVSHSVKEITH